jgi:hypothetical protein
MAARMALVNEKVSSFHSILLEYLSQCIIDHPHHVLPVIFARAGTGPANRYRTGSENQPGR